MHPPTPQTAAQSASTTSLQRQVVIERGQTQLCLLPNKTLWWPHQRALILADTHFGKASTFRRAGLPVPVGTTARMLQQLSTAIDVHQPQQLLIVGDFVHSSTSAGQDFEEELRAWRARYQALQVVLIKGNHDRRSQDFYDQLKIDLHHDTLWIDDLAFCHDPVDAPVGRFSICGHLHPGYRLRASDSLCLPCFLVGQSHLILPAFGEFTGRSPTPLTKPASNPAIYQVAYLVCDQMLAKVNL